MSIPIITYGDSIAPGSQPVLVFPIVAIQILAAINLDSTWSGTGTVTGLTEGTAAWAGAGIDNDVGVPAAAANITDPGAGKGLQGYLNEKPIAGQLANLNVQVSKDGVAWAAGTGVLAEIASGYYRYVPATTETDSPPTRDSSNTGQLSIRVYPTNPVIVANFYIMETFLSLRLRPPGLPLVNINPGQKDVILSDVMQPVVNDLKAFIRTAIRDLLGNQLTNKPTLRRDP